MPVCYASGENAMADDNVNVTDEEKLRWLQSDKWKARA